MEERIIISIQATIVFVYFFVIPYCLALKWSNENQYIYGLRDKSPFIDIVFETHDDLNFIGNCIFVFLKLGTLPYIVIYFIFKFIFYIIHYIIKLLFFKRK